MNSMPDWAILVASALLQAMKEKDPYTYGHCMRVARYAELLAEAAGLPENEQLVIKYSSMFHDLGKIGIPDEILQKKGKLSVEEEKIMKEHPIKSEEIIKPLASHVFFKSLLPGIRHHHERMDGRGYPDRYKGDEIPLYARIILIVDTFDAMTTTRPYRKGLGFEFAFKELKLFAGRQFDPHLVKIFLKAQPTWGRIEEKITEDFIFDHFINRIKKAA